MLDIFKLKLNSAPIIIIALELWVIFMIRKVGSRLKPKCRGGCDLLLAVGRFCTQ